MTRDQYKRLIKVATLPLLLAGLLLSFATSPGKYTHIICEYVDRCWRASDDGWWSYEGVKSRQGPLFDVNTMKYEDNKFPTASISAARMLIPNAQIVGVSTYSGTSEQTGSPYDQLKGMIGQRIILQMGSEDRENEVRLLNPLGCNELNLIQAPSFFEAGLCGVPDGVVKVRFVTGPDDSQTLKEFRETIEEQIGAARSDLIIHFVLVTLLPLFLFFAMSGIVLAIRKAWLYVAKG